MMHHPFKVYVRGKLAGEHKTRVAAEKRGRRILAMSHGRISASEVEIRHEPRQKNPRGAAFESVRTLYRNFRGREPSRIGRVSVPPSPRAVMTLGYLREVKYDSTGEVGPRVHTFRAGSRPLLCSDGKRLYILRGRFRVTSRGIVDIDSNGHEEA